MQFGCWTFVISISFWCPWNDINNASWSLNFLRNFYPCFYFLPLLDGDCLWLFRFEYPQPTFQKLLKEQCMEPFFVFQVLSLNHILSFLISSSEFYISPCVIFFCLNSVLYMLYIFSSWHSSLVLQYICIGVLCGALVLGWILVLQLVYPLYAVYVRVNYGKE
jgi:hypothetical protein